MRVYKRGLSPPSANEQVARKIPAARTIICSAQAIAHFERTGISMMHDVNW